MATSEGSSRILWKDQFKSLTPSLREGKRYPPHLEQRGRESKVGLLQLPSLFLFMLHDKMPLYSRKFVNLYIGICLLNFFLQFVSIGFLQVKYGKPDTSFYNLIQKCITRFSLVFDFLFNNHIIFLSSPILIFLFKILVSSFLNKLKMSV